AGGRPELVSELCPPRAAEFRVDRRRAWDVPAWPRQAENEPGNNRVGNRAKDHGNRRGRVLRGHGGWCGEGEDKIDLVLNKFCNEPLESIEVTVSIPVLDNQVAAIDETKVS